MMSVTSSAASLLHALIGPDAANAPADQPPADVAEFAALISGLGIVAQPGDIQSSASADPTADDPASDDTPDDGTGTNQDGSTENDPLAAALAMLPTAVAQAAVALPTAATGNGAEQPLPSISAVALARLARPPAAAVALTDDAASVADANADADSSVAISGLPPAVAAMLTASQKAGAPSPATPSSPVRGVPTDAAATNPAAGAAAQAATTKRSSRDSASGVASGVAPDARRKADDDAAALLGLDDDSAAQANAATTIAATAQSDPGASGPKADASTPQVPLGQALANHHLAIASDGQWLDQLARDIATTASPEGKLRFQLNPEHLGSLQVEVTRGAEGASLRLTADTDAARTILIDARPRLEAEARAQGVRIAETHVDLGGQNAGQGAAGESPGRQAAQDQQPFVRAIRADVAAAAITDTGSDEGAGGAAAERYA
jgi:flagellar hook-length control protein FliK